MTTVLPHGLRRTTFIPTTASTEGIETLAHVLELQAKIESIVTTRCTENNNVNVTVRPGRDLQEKYCGTGIRSYVERRC